MTHNAYKSSSSELDPASAEAIDRGLLVKLAEPQYRGDTSREHLAIRCNTPGDVLTFKASQAGENGGGGWMDLGRGGSGVVWVVTAHGKYGISGGFVYNHNESNGPGGGLYLLDPSATEIEIRVGQGMKLPGVSDGTSDVKSVLINDEVGPDYSWTGKDVTKAGMLNADYDPLIVMRQISTAAARGESPAMDLALLKAAASRPQGTSSV